MRVSGYSARFNTLSYDMGGWKERIARGAFSRSLRSGKNVIATREHSNSNLLGSTKSGSLTLSEDDAGLRFSLLLPQTTEGKDTYELCKRGDLGECSFSFQVDPDDGDSWAEEDDYDPDDPDCRNRRIPIRTLKNVRLLETSLCAMPAYPATSVSADSYNPNPSIGVVGGRSLRDYFPDGMPAEVRSHVGHSPVSVTLNAESQVDAAEKELARLSMKPDLSRSDQKKIDGLISIIANGTRSLLSKSEQANWAAARLMREAQGVDTRKLSAKTEKEFRNFLFGGEIPRSLQHREERAYSPNSAGEVTLSFSNTSGSTLCAPEVYQNLVFSLKEYDRLFDPAFSQRVETDTGTILPIPLVDDVSGASYLCSESSGVNAVDIQGASESSLRSWKFSSGLIILTLELLQDGYWNWSDLLLKACAARHSRGVGKYFVTGTGASNNQPMGLLPGVLGAGNTPITVIQGSSGNTGGSETGQTTVGSKDLNSIMTSLDASTRQRGAWYLHPSTLDYFQSLVDKQGRPLISYRKSYYDEDESKYPVLLNRPVCVSPSFSPMGASVNSIVYGVPNYFITRFVKDAYWQRFTEAQNLVEYGLVAFANYLRVDSAILPTPTIPVWAIGQQHS